MTTTVYTTIKTGRLAFCSPLCKDPSRKGTRRIALGAITVRGECGSPGLDPSLSVFLATQDGHAMQVDLDASTATSLHCALSVEMGKLDEGHAPAVKGLSSDELALLKSRIRPHVEGIRLVSADNVVRILAGVRSAERLGVAELLVRMRPDLLTPIMFAMVSIGG